jgi:hypothetical protein
MEPDIVVSYIVQWEDEVQWDDKVETRLETAEEVCRFLDRIATEVDADFWVLIDRGRRPSWVKRLFGLSERVLTPCFHLQKAGEVAALCFLDDAWSEYRALDPERPTDVSEETRLKLSGGELTPVDPEECMTAARAFVAAHHYIMSGKRPEWMSYRYVR